MAAEWEHLLPLVDLLRAEGNETTRGGFQPNQGGWDCEMRDRLDFAALRPLVAADEHADKIAFEDDRVFCAHCWATITQHTATPLRGCRGVGLCPHPGVGRSLGRGSCPRSRA
jgi:hypothetical protein